MKYLALLLITSVALAQTQPSARVEKIVNAAIAQVGVTLTYDSAYTSLKYPMGDVPLERGVCSDVIIRALRATGIDLQQLVHEDMKQNFSAYPPLWDLRRPDANIDHRRVANLEVFLQRRNKAVSTTANFLAGDIVTWTLPTGRLHIGLITNQLEPTGKRPLVVHNIGSGAQLEDVLMTWNIRRHFRYF